MANKKYKLTDGNMWATDGIHDFGQNKTQRTINSEVNSALGGKAPTNHASTATTYGAASTSNYGHVKLSNTTPSMDGTAAVGDSTDVARANHVHPSDTSRVPTTRKINGMNLSQDRTLTSENIGYNSSTTYSSGTVGKAVSELSGAITSNPNIKFRSVGNSIMTGSVWVNGAADHLTGYNDSPYAIIATSLGIRQANVTHTMLSGSGMTIDIGNGTFYDYIVTNNLNLTGYDYLMTMLWTSDMYNKPIGSINDEASTDTIAGRIVGIVNYLKTNYPKVNLILLGVPPTNYDTGKTGNTVFTGVYSNGFNIKQCDALMHTLAEKYHFTFIDFEQWMIAYYYQNFTDGNNVHANADNVYRLMGEYLANNLKGQIECNSSYFKSFQLISDNVSGAYSGWRNIFNTDNPDIDEYMTITDICAFTPIAVQTTIVAWRVVAGNVQIYGNINASGTTFYVTLTRTNQKNNAGIYHVSRMTASTIVVDTAIGTEGTETLTTYNGRLFSDYPLLEFCMGEDINNYRNTVVIPTGYFSANKRVYLQANHGTNLANVGGCVFTYNSDSSVNVYLVGSKAFTHVSVLGMQIT